MDYCKGYMEHEAYGLMLWITAVVLICLGYILCVYLIGMAFFACVVFCVFRSWEQDQTEEESHRQH